MRRLLPLAFVLVPSAWPAAGQEWPQYRGNPGHTGVSPDGSVKPPLKLLWSYRCDSDTSGDAGAGVTVAGGKVFANMEMTRSILALDADTGRFLWEYAHRDVHYQQTSSYGAGRLFVWLRAYGRSSLVALDAETGKEVWSRKFKGSQRVIADRRGPVLHEGKVLLADADDEPVIVALDGKSGQEVWRAPLGTEDGEMAVAPCVAGGRAFTGTRIKFERGKSVHGAVIALDPANGKVLWRNRKIYPCAPMVSDGRLLVCKINREIAMPPADNQKLYLLDAVTGEELWSVPIQSLYGTTTITKDKVLQRHYGGRIVANDLQSGKPLWTFSVRTGSGCSTPSVSGDCAYVGTGSFNDSEGFWAWRFVEPPHRYQGGQGVSWTLHAVDLRTGKSVWHFVTGCNVCGDPAIAYGRLYFNSRDGRIYCLVPAEEGEPATPESPDRTPNAPAEEVERLLAEKVPGPRPGRDWPMEGGSPDRAGLEGVTLKPPLEPAWTLETGGRIVTSAAICDGRVFVGSTSGKIVAADLKTGRQVWEFNTGAAVRSSPAVAGGTVYCGSDSGTFYALEAASGKEKWSFRTGGAIEAAPAVAGAVVIFGANDHNIYALDRTTGRKLWRFRTEAGFVHAPPVVHGNRVFAAQWTDWVYALDAATGTERWRSCVPISIEALTFYRGTLWLRSPRQVAEFDPGTGKRLRIGNAMYGYNGLAFMKNVLFISGVEGATAVNLEGAGEEMKTKVPNLEGVGVLGGKYLLGWPRLASMGTPLVLGETLCFASREGQVILTDPAGKVLWKFAMGGACHATPVAADGVLVVGCDDGRLYAFREVLAHLPPSEKVPGTLTLRYLVPFPLRAAVAPSGQTLAREAASPAPAREPLQGAR